MTNSHTFEKLTADNAVMLLIDHQVGTMNWGISDIDALHLKNNTLFLAESAKAFGLPAILTTSNPNGPNGPLFSELIATLPDAPVIDRLIINAWDDPKFVEAVKKTGRRKLIMAGVTSDVCLTFPALGAVRDDYDVYAVMDASGTVNQHALMAAMFRMNQAGVKIANTNMVLAELIADWSGKFGAPLGKLFTERIPNFSFSAALLAHQAELQRS